MSARGYAIHRVCPQLSFFLTDHKSILRRDQKRRMAQLSSADHSGAPGGSLMNEDDLHAAWEQVSELDKQKYYNRALRALKLITTPRRHKHKGKTSTRNIIRPRLSEFQTNEPNFPGTD